MSAYRGRGSAKWAWPLLLAGCLLVWNQPARSGDKDKEDTDKGASHRVEVPVQVSKALDARFPSSKVEKVSKEMENGVEVYDFEFKHKGHRFEADITADGTIQNWEEAVAQADVPEAVQKAVQAAHPGAIWHDAMRITKVDKGKDVVEGYEVQLELLNSQMIEVTLDPAGKVLEDEDEGD